MLGIKFHWTIIYPHNLKINKSGKRAFVSLCDVHLLQSGAVITAAGCFIQEEFDEMDLVQAFRFPVGSASSGNVTK